MNHPLPTTRLLSPPQGDASQLTVPGYLYYQLPPVYRPEQLVADVLAAFETPPGRPVRLKAAVNAWQQHALYGDPARSQSALAASSQAVEYWTFFHRFRRSELRQWFLDQCGGDPATAAEAFLHALSEELAGQETIGRTTLPRMGKRMIDRAAGGLRIPFAPPLPGGDHPGTAHAQLVARLYRIADLLQRLRLRYAPYRQRSVEYTEVPYPDDLDIVRLRSFTTTDLLRITLSDQLLPDREFYSRLADRRLSQIIYTEPKPAPPRRFVMLLDVSGSMGNAVRNTAYTREAFAVASAIALLESALAGGNEAILIRFDGQPHPPLSGTPAEIVTDLLTGKFSGGGTSIDAALRAAADHRPEEIILITDGDAPVQEQPAAPLVTYLCGGTNDSLQRLSRTYQKVEDTLS